MAGARISFKGMAAGAVLLGAFLLTGGAVAHAAGCSQAAACPYLEVSVFGKDPATGAGIFRSPQAVATSPGGEFVWVADQISGVVQKFDQQGNFVSQIGWFADKGQLGRFGVVGGLATDRNNHLYVLDSQYGRVQVFRSNTGAWVGAWGSKGAGPGTFNLGVNHGSGGIAVFQPTAQDSPVAFIADQLNHRVQRFTLDQFSTADPSAPVLPAGSVDPGSPNYVPAPSPSTTWGSFGNCAGHGCGQTGDRYHFNLPGGIAVNPQTGVSGQVQVYVADTLNHRIVQYTGDGAYLGEAGGLGSANGRLKSPHDASVDQAGNVFVADTGNHRVQRFNAGDLGFLGAWGGLGPGQSRLDSPRSLGSPAAAGGVYVADSGNHRVQGFSPAESLVASWGTVGRGGAGYVTRPSGIAVDRSGNLYIGDTWAHRIEKLSGAGAYLAQWGRILTRNNLSTVGSGDGQFFFPRGVAYDPAGGNLWVADQNNHRIQVLTTAGIWLAKYGGPAAGTATGQFDLPHAVAVAPNGDVFVADTGNNRVQKRDAFGTWSLVSTGTALDAPAALAVDGQGTLFVADRTRVLRIEAGTATIVEAPPPTPFDRPGGLHAAGNKLFVSDTGNSRVLRLDRLTGEWQQIGSEGPEVGAFVSPSELSTTPDGRTLYVTDQHNNRIQRFLLEALPGPKSSGRPSAGSQPATGPDRDRPRLRLRARLRQQALRRGAVLISIRCTERCLTEASGKLQIRRTGRSLPLRRVRRQLASDKRVTLALRFSKRTKRRLRRALARGWRVNAKVVVVGRDLAGNRTIESRRIRIRP